MASGPYETSDEVRRLPAVRAVYDVMHDATGRGAGQGECERMLAGACEAAGVALGAYDARILRWLANWEAETVAVVAGWVARAHEAGKAAAVPGGVTVEWGVHRPGIEAEGTALHCGRGGEALARQLLREWRRVHPGEGVLMRREIGAWRPVPESSEEDDHA